MPSWLSIISYPTSVSGINCFIKNDKKILLDFADFTLQEELADNLMVSISQPCQSNCLNCIIQ